MDLRPTRLNCILQDLFRDTPHDHILRAQICTQICIFGIFGHIWHIWVHIWARKIWSSGVSLKRSCKMQFRRVGLRSIGPSSQKLWQNQIFDRFPRCNYNVKLQSGGGGHTAVCVIFLPSYIHFPLTRRGNKKKVFFGLPSDYPAMSWLFIRLDFQFA